MQQVRVAARRKYTPEEKVRIVLEGFRREVAVNELCHREGIKRDIERLQREGFLAPAWTLDEAVGFTWALLSVHTYKYLVIERGWPVEQFVRRLRKMLRCVLVKDRGAMDNERQG